MELKDRLKILREEKGWNKTEAAKKMGVSVGAYSNWEYGNRIPDYQNLKDLSELFEVSVLYLREGEKTFLDMLEKEAKVNGESLDDSILDAANYLVMWYVERQKEKN